MVWSGAAADERVVTEPGSTDRPTRLQALVGRILGSRALIFVLVGALLFVFARSFQEPGHTWGDDFALYINQARALTDGTTDDVVADTRFAIDNSAYSSFSPEAYPWGFPALLAFVIAARGIDYEWLKAVPTLSYVGAVLVLYLLLANRVPRAQALAVSALFALNTWYVGRTDQVLSDLTFWFLVLLALYVLDRRVRADTMLAGYGALGAAVCMLVAFNVRREGALLLGALAAAQLAAWIAARCADTPAPTRRWRAVITPYIAFVVGAVVIHLLRPATIVNSSEDVGASGFQHAWANLSWYWNPLAEQLGLQQPGARDLDLFGSASAATIFLGSLLALAAIGVIIALTDHPRRDIHLVVVVLLIGLAVVIQPFKEGRYIITLVPFVAYFALRAVRAGVSAVARGSKRPARAVRYAIPLLVFVPLLGNAAIDTRESLTRHLESNSVVWGPEHPDAQALLTAVEKYTAPDDVVVFAQSRTMNLYTGRRSIQGNSVAMMLQSGDWFAMARGSDYIQTPLTDTQASQLGFRKVWENAMFVLWRIP